MKQIKDSIISGLLAVLLLVVIYLLIGANQTIHDQQKRINLLETVITTTLKADSIQHQLEIGQIKAVNGDGHDTSNK